MVFINYHRVSCGAACSDPLKELYLKEELTLFALGSLSAQPIKDTIIHFGDRFCSNWSCLLYSSFSTAYRTPAYLYDSWQGWGERNFLLLVTEWRNHSFQIKIADKWPYKAKEIKEVWEWGKLDSLASNSIWLKPTGDSLHSGGSEHFLRLQSHLGLPDDPWGVRKKPWSYSTH